MFFVGLDDHLHQLVADDIFVGKINELDRVNVAYDVLGFLETALLATGTIDLGLVPGDDGL